MAISATITAAAAYRAFVQDFSPELIQRAFYAAQTPQHARVLENIKGRLTLTRLVTGANKAVAYSSSFSGAADAVTLSPRHLDVVGVKRDLTFVPQDFEASYLGMMRQAGQNAGKDLPFEAFIIQSILDIHAEEMDAAYWGAVQAASVTPGTTPLNETYDGFLEIIKDAITATTLPAGQVVVTPGGVVTIANVVALIETMWNGLSAGQKNGAVNVYMSWANFQKYQQGYRADFGKFVSNNKDQTVTLDFSQNARLIPMPGMGTSNRIVMTSADNLVIGYDQISDEMFQVEADHRAIDFFMDFKVGVQIAMLNEAQIIVNDLL